MKVRVFHLPPFFSFVFKHLHHTRTYKDLFVLSVITVEYITNDYVNSNIVGEDRKESGLAYVASDIETAKDFCKHNSDYYDTTDDWHWLLTLWPADSNFDKGRPYGQHIARDLQPCDYEGKVIKKEDKKANLMLDLLSQLKVEIERLVNKQEFFE